MLLHPSLDFGLARGCTNDKSVYKYFFMERKTEIKIE